MLLHQIEDEEFRKFLKHHIQAFNNRHSALHLEARVPGFKKPLIIKLEDDFGDVVGGLAAFTYWDWLDIDDFFIPAHFRREGTGSKVLEVAEQTAIERGCKWSRLTTFEFQARKFYERHGYTVVGTLEDYPPGSAWYLMRKGLS
jgi:GNAT superfamily N-acetyltransferase